MFLRLAFRSFQGFVAFVVFVAAAAAGLQWQGKYSWGCNTWSVMAARAAVACTGSTQAAVCYGVSMVFACST